MTELKQVEKTLKETSLRLEAIIAAIPDIIMEVDSDKIYTWANQAGINFFGEDVIGKKADYFFEGEQKTYQIVQPVFASSEDVIYVESWQRRRDGRKRLLAWQCRTLKDEFRNVKGAVSTAVDITERHQAYEEQRVSEERFRQVVENIHEAYWIRDRRTNRILYVSPAYETIWGRTREEVYRKSLSFMEDVHPEDQKRVSVSRSALYEEGRPFDEEYRIIRPDRSIRWVRARTYAIFGQNKEISTFIGVAEDITERKRAEEKLEAERDIMRTLINNLPDNVFIKDTRGGIILDNLAHRRLLGRQELDEVVGKSDRDFFAPVLADRYMDDERRIVESGQPMISYEEPTVDPEGRPHWLLTTKVPVRDIHGKTTALVGINRDITEIKRAEEELRKSEGKYRLLVDNATDIVWTMDLSTYKFTYFSPLVQKIRGFTPAEAMEIPLDKTLTLDSYKRALAELGEAFEREKAPSSDPDFISLHEFQEYCKDGSIISTEVRIRFLRDAKGLPTAILGMTRDVTERKRMEEALRNAEENFRRSMEESPIGIRVVSAEGETLYANRAILDIYGYDDIEEMRTTPVKKRYTPASYIEYELRKKKRMNGEDNTSEYEISIITKTGEIRHLQVFRKEILWDGQKRSQAIYQDITERKKAENKLNETLGSLRNALGGIFQVLSATTEKRDPYTAGHQRRVADLARAIGQEMRLPAKQVEGLRIAGTIHDIGKVSIPAEILSKPTRLAELEYKLIQCHSQIGYDILREINFAWPLAEIVLQHHERMNGSGYPNQLKGEEILLEARILAVSDVVEAMASHRPYRPALGIAMALEEIEKNKGILYDPDVVSACLTLFRGKGFKFK